MTTKVATSGRRQQAVTAFRVRGRWRQRRQQPRDIVARSVRVGLFVFSLFLFGVRTSSAFSSDHRRGWWHGQKISLSTSPSSLLPITRWTTTTTIKLFKTHSSCVSTAFINPCGGRRDRGRGRGRGRRLGRTAEASRRRGLEASSSDGGSVEDFLDEGERLRTYPRIPLLEKVGIRARLAVGAVRRWMRRVYIWQKTHRKSLLAAVAVAMSVLLASDAVLDRYQHHRGAATQHLHHVVNGRPEIHRVVAPAAPRGGGGGGGTTTATAAAAAVEKGLVKLERDVAVVASDNVAGRTIGAALRDLSDFMRGPKSDTLLLLAATALVPALCHKVGASPILGFLAAGMLLGPNGLGVISGIHTTETLAELGIVFFLFEMGIELSIDRLLSMRKDVFGLGFLQFMTTALAVAGAGRLVGGARVPANALVVLGGGLALSSSAFVLQLLKDKNQLATRFGKAAFGVLLFQDLAVVPLLVVTPLLAGNAAAGGTAAAVGGAVVKAALALGSIAFAGRVVLNPMFKTVAAAQSQEAFLGVILLTVLSMSFLTEGLGLSNTLGAFLAGVLLSETKYRFQVEADIAPFRGVLLGLFFVTVGFEIDLNLIASNLPAVAGLVVGIIAVKAVITTALSLAFGLSLATSQNTGLILSQGGEFAFVAFGLARSLGILDAATTKLMLTSVSLTMALTPLMSTLGGRIAKRLEERADFTHYLGQDRDANEIKESDDFAVVVGYGVVGRVVCDLLDRKLIKYEGLELDPNKAIQARNAGLPVFYGDIARQEVAEAFNVGKAKAVIVCISDRAQCNRAVIALRRWYPDLKIFARARDADHAKRLQETLNVAAMVPILPEDNLLLTLPFGGAVMKALGVPTEEVNAIIEAKRKEVLSGRGLDENEEEAALLQLGISKPDEAATEPPSPSPLKATSAASGGSEVLDAEVVAGDGGEGDSGEAVATAAATTTLTRIEEAATERREEALEKSPFVAKVIEDVCLAIGSSEEEQEEEVENAETREEGDSGPAAQVAEEDEVEGGMAWDPSTDAPGTSTGLGGGATNGDDETDAFQ